MKSINKGFDMKYTAILFLTLVCVCYAQNGYNQSTVAGKGTATNPNMANPTYGGGANYSTTPPTTYTRGLKRSPTPQINPMPGSVDSGRYFRGMMPYNESVGTYFNDYNYLYNMNQDYSTKNPILNRVIPSYQGISTSAQGQTGTTGRYLSPMAGNEYYRYRNDATLLLEAQRQQARYGRPLTGLSEDFERLMKLRYFMEPVTQTYEQQREFYKKYHDEIDKMADQPDDLRQDLRIPENVQRYDDKRQGLTAQKLPQAPEPAQIDQKVEQDDIYSQMLKKIEAFQKQYEEIVKLREPEPNKEDFGKKPPQSEKTKTRITESKETGSSLSSAAAQNADEKQENKKTDSQEYKSLASNKEDVFNRYMKQAEISMKEKKYYEAADYYTLASIFKNYDPLAIAGRGYALFGAGEYMSSAMYIARAIEIFPSYLEFNINVTEVIGDKDLIEKRIEDLKQITDRNEMPELQFLIGYMSYRLNNLEQARKYVNRAKGKIPDMIALQELDKAIGN